MRDFDIEDFQVRLEFEQILLAWIRTGLGLMAFGFLVANLGVFLQAITSSGLTPTERPQSEVWVGTLFLLLGAAVNFSAAIRHKRHTATTTANANAPFTSKLAFLVAVLTGVFALVLAGYVFSY
jgi:putative membrane protein